MRALSAAQLLAVWERGLEQRPVERALRLLEAACPESTPEILAGLSIGRRDAALLTLRGWAFGSRIVGRAVCPRCGQQSETSIEAAALQQNARPPWGDTTPEVSLSIAGYEVRFRTPNSADIEACAGANVAEIRKRLFSRCLLAARTGKSENEELVEAEQLPETVADAVVEHMAKADPQADLKVDISCPACDYHWCEAFDIVSFFWTEIDAWARRILQEVHILASAYGWREADILALHPLRRQFYLEMAGP